MPKKKYTHVHKYKRFNIGAQGKEYLVFRCMVPDCSHYIPVITSIGRTCICNRCDELMIIDKASAKLSKPHCANCIEKIIDGEKVKVAELHLDDFLKDKGI